MSDETRPGSSPDYVRDDPETYAAAPVDPAGFGPAQGQAPMTATPPGGRATKGRTIALILAGVVTVGLLGAVAGLVLGDDGSAGTPSPPASPLDRAEAAGVVSGRPPAITLAAGLNAPLGAALTSTQDLTPEGEDPDDAGETDDPDDGGGLGGDLGGDLGSDEGQLVTLDPGVDVYVPPGWEVIGQDDTAMLQHAGRTYVFSITGVTDPSTEAAALMQEIAPDLLPDSTYTQFESSEITPVEPTGSLVSLAFVDYVATYVDAQSSSPIYGRLIVGIRQDGVVLAMTIESSPPKAFNKEQPDWTLIPGVTFTVFSGQ
jgi:hypothetical protein